MNPNELKNRYVGALVGVEAIDKQWLREVENSDLLIGVKNGTWLYCPFGGTV